MSSATKSAPRPSPLSPALRGRPFSTFSEATAGVLAVLETHLPGSLAYVARLDPDGEALRVVAVEGDEALGVLPGTTLGPDARRAGSAIAVPLELDSGQWAGSLGVLHREADRFGASELQLLSLLGRLLASTRQAQLREEELAARAFEDGLRREWQLAKRGTLRSHLAVLEAEQLEAPDDGAGEGASDRLGRALDAVTRATDVVTRLDRRRFAVVLVGCATAPDARDFRRRLVAELDRAAGDQPALTLLMGTESLDVPPSPQGALDAAGYALERDRSRRAAGAPNRLASVLLTTRRRLR